MMAKDQLTRFRSAICDETTGPKFGKILASEKAKGVVVTGGRFEALKRSPRGFPDDHPRSEWLRWKGVEIPIRVGSPKWLRTPGAITEIAKLLAVGKPLTDWLDAYVGPSALTPEEIWGR